MRYFKFHYMGPLFKEISRWLLVDWLNGSILQVMHAKMIMIQLLKIFPALKEL
jgi:hypothetical protein